MKEGESMRGAVVAKNALNTSRRDGQRRHEEAFPSPETSPDAWCHGVVRSVLRSDKPVARGRLTAFLCHAHCEAADGEIIKQTATRATANAGHMITCSCSAVCSSQQVLNKLPTFVVIEIKK